LTAVGGTLPYTWSITSGGLPSGLSLSSSGVISGTPDAATNASFTVQVVGGSLSSTGAFSLTIYPAEPTITSASPLPSGTVGAAYSQTLAASGSTTPYVWSIASGSLPVGLTLSTNGVISGTPSMATIASFAVQVMGNNGLAATNAFTLTIIPVITTSSPLPSGIVGTAYNQALTANGGTTPYTWSIFSGGLPSGLDLTTDGVISGTPSMATNASFTVQVTDNNGLSSTKAFALTIAVASPQLAAALDQPDWLVTTSGSQPWFSQTTNTHDGVDAARSGLITDGQASWMQTALTGPGTLTYWRKVSSESGYDYLEFYLDGVLQSGGISGTVNWQKQTNSIPDGSHTVEWRYMKDEFVSSGQDAGWVDEVSYAGLVPLQFAVTNGSLSVSNGLFNMRLTGPPGASVVVDRSFNLTTWTPWQTNPLPIGGLDLAMPVGTNGQQFFRARMP
jgi:hypothetical protein